MNILHNILNPEHITNFVTLRPRDSGGADVVASEYLPISNAYTCDKHLEYFCINPLAGERSDLNVIAFLNFLLEDDSTPIDKQLELLQPHFQEFRLVTYSGNKSMQLIVSMADTLPAKVGTPEGIKRYNRMAAGLMLYYENLTGLTFDPSTKNPSRLARLPGIIRTSTGKEQKLISVGALKTAEFVTSLELPDHIACTPVNFTTNTLSDFEALLTSSKKCWGLRDTLRYYVHDWGGPINMRPKLFNYTLWAIDLTGCSYEAIWAYLSKYTLPVLAAKGYPSDKFEEPVKSAFRFKKFI